MARQGAPWKKHCQQFGNARMSAGGSAHWPESAMDGGEYKNIWNVFGLL
jgi:hypothetical protein